MYVLKKDPSMTIKSDYKTGQKERYKLAEECWGSSIVSTAFGVFLFWASWEWYKESGLNNVDYGFLVIFIGFFLFVWIIWLGIKLNYETIDKYICYKAYEKACEKEKLKLAKEDADEFFDLVDTMVNGDKGDEVK